MTTIGKVKRHIMKNTLIILASILLVSCAAYKAPENINKNSLLAAMPSKCGGSTLIVGEVKSYGDKGAIWGYFLQTTPTERVYLHDLKTKLEVGKKILVSGVYQPKNIGGLLMQSGGTSAPHLESDLMDVRIHRVLNKDEAIGIETIKKECELLKNR